MTYFANGQTVTVTPPPSIDATGDPVTPVAPFDVDNVSITVSAVTMSRNAENLDRRTTTESRALLEFPAGQTIPVDSHFTLPDGSSWRMSGISRTPHNPFTGWEPGVTVNAKEVR